MDNRVVSQSGTDGTQNTVSDEFFECANEHLENAEAQYNYNFRTTRYNYNIRSRSRTRGKTGRRADRPLAELDIEDGNRIEDSEDGHLQSRPSQKRPGAEATRHHQIRSKSSMKERCEPPIRSRSRSYRSCARSPSMEVGGKEQAAWSREVYLTGFLNREKEQGITRENDLGLSIAE